MITMGFIFNISFNFIQYFREGNGNPLQYSCLENPMDGGAWQATVHGVTQSWTQLSMYVCMYEQQDMHAFKLWC